MGGQESSQQNKVNDQVDADGDVANLDDELTKWEEVIVEMETMFQSLCDRHPEVRRIYESSKGLMQNPVKEFMRDMLDSARPPVIYLLGRNGHGKSSLLNALAKQEVSDSDCATPSASFDGFNVHFNVYDINFGGKDCSWKIVDSRVNCDINQMPYTNQVKKDLLTYKPDVILHLVSCTEARDLSKDLQLLRKVFKMFDSNADFPPVILVLTKADMIGHTQQWPPCDYPTKQKVFDDLLKYVSKNVLSAKECKPLLPIAEYYGLQLDGCKPFLYVIPVATVVDEPTIRWNIDELSLVIGNTIPSQAWLYFYRGGQHKHALRALTEKVIEKFSVMATSLFFFNISRH